MYGYWNNYTQKKGGIKLIKRTVLVILISLLFFTINNTIVYADDEDIHEITYDIENINISNESITFKGWGYIRRVNNVGGETMSISMTATTGAVGSAGITVNVGNGGYGEQDLYAIMCVRTMSGNKCHPKSEASSRCTEAANYDGCLYENGRFELSFSLKKLYETFKDSEIFFDLNISTSGVSRTIRIGALDKNVKGSSVNWLAKTQTSNTVYIAVGSKPFVQTIYGTRRVPNELWYKNVEFSVARYSIVKFTPPKELEEQYKDFKDVNIGTYCDKNGRCAYGSWVRTSNVFSLKLEEAPNCNANDNKNLQCEDGNFNNSCDTTVIAGQVSASGSGGCPGGTSDVVAVVNINQNGNLKFSLDRGPIYSGGGFTFSVVYNNSVSWDYTKNGYKGCPSIKVYYSSMCGLQPCCKSTYVYSSECPDPNSDSYYERQLSKQKYEEFVNKAMAKKYQGLVNSSATVTMKDSNKVDGGSNNDTGTWECTGPNPNNITSWTPNTTLSSSCKFTLYDAFIDKESSDVSYNITGDNNYLSEGAKYFIPLKYPTGNFPVKAEFYKLSSVKDMNWSATYECDVKCQQKLYDFENGGYLYYFRPISLSKPFPNRDPGRNWYEWIQEGGDLKRLAETYTSNNNIEYYVSLSNNDIANIKQYNYNANYNGGKGYLDLDVGKNFDINGNSKFIKDYNYFTLGNVNHSGLGVFDPEEDTQ